METLLLPKRGKEIPTFHLSINKSPNVNPFYNILFTGCIGVFLFTFVQFSYSVYSI